MAASNLTQKRDHRVDTHHDYHTSIIEKRVLWDPAITPDLLTIATHTLFNVEIGEAYLGMDMIVQEAFTSAGAPTLRFNIDGNFLTGNILKAALAVGNVLSFGGGPATATGGVADVYRKTAASTLVGVVAVAAYDTGKALITGYFRTNLNTILA